MLHNTHTFIVHVLYSSNTQKNANYACVIVRQTQKEHARTRHIWTHPSTKKTETDAKRRALGRSTMPTKRHHAHAVEAGSVHRLPDSGTSRGHGHAETGPAAQDERTAERGHTRGLAVHHVGVCEQHGSRVLRGPAAVQWHVIERENAAHAFKHDADAVGSCRDLRRTCIHISPTTPPPLPFATHTYKYT